MTNVRPSTSSSCRSSTSSTSTTATSSLRYGTSIDIAEQHRHRLDPPHTPSRPSSLLALPSFRPFPEPSPYVALVESWPRAHLPIAAPPRPPASSR